jgi:hypothetical protein
MIKWIKNLFKINEAEVKPVIKDCERCRSIGYYTGLNTDYRETLYWCDCKKINGKYPNNCATIDERWETCSHKMIIDNDYFPTSFNGFKPPNPDTIFEPYLKVYVYKQSEKIILGRVLFVKKLSYDGLSVRWVDLGGFYDEVEYSNLVAEIREQKLKELGI